MSEAENSGSVVADDGKSSKKKTKQLVISDALKLYLSEVFIQLLDTDDDNPDKILLLCLEPRSHGRGNAFDRLVNYLSESENPLIVGKQTTKQSVSTWINDCMKMGIAENERLERDGEAGPTQFRKC